MIEAILMLLLGMVVIGLIIVWNAFHVAQEFAYMSVDRNDLRREAREGNTRAELALKVTNRTSFMLSGAQLGITVSGLLVGFITGPLIGEALGDIFEGFNVPRSVSVGVGTVVALAITTVVQMIFGELFPKNYTIAAPMKSALALARPTLIYMTLTGWLIAFFDWAANTLLKIFGIEPVEDVDSSTDRDDLSRVIESSHDAGDIDDNTWLVLDRMLDFREQDVDHAMIPRSRVEVLELTATVAEARELMHQSHTRYPVINDDHVPVGVVHLLDVLDPELRPDTPVATVMKEPVIVPELMALPDAVHEIRDADDKIACVIDEYGGFIGIVTLEDLGEEVLGDITDRYEVADTEEIHATADSEWIADGDTPLDEVIRAVGYDLPDGEYETLAGLLMNEAGGLIEEGETVTVTLEALPDDYVDGNGEDLPERLLRAEVLEVERNVPSEIRLTLIEPAAGAAEEEN